MYLPRSNRWDDEAQLRAFVAAAASAHLVTCHEGVPDATLLPVLWQGDRVIAHLARANDHWRRIVDGAPGLIVVRGPDAYISPSWYPAKARHGRVVPTWNYTEVQLRGPVTTTDDVAWLRAAVTAVTDRHEQGRERPWQVSDAPADYLEGLLRGIVGVELLVTDVTGKAKLSQNRAQDDREGVIAGLASEPGPGAAGVREAMLRPQAPGGVRREGPAEGLPQAT